MSTIQSTELDSGLRVITDFVPDSHSVALGTWIGVGTRHENRIHNGVAHLTEHMVFKGTEKRSTQDISEVIENVGGNINAYTSREITSYHIHLLKEDVALALDVLADILQNPTLPAEELELERKVVLQEIGMSMDTPDDIIFDHYQEAAYPRQSIGSPILGKANIIESMERSTILDYICRFYTPSRTVVAAAGNIDHDEFVKMVEDQFAHQPPDMHHGKIDAKYQGGESRHEKELEQSHVILGFEGLSRTDDDYYAAQALSALLGGGMSSRLFQEVREKRGLAYSIFSFHSGYNDTGQFGIYAGTGPKGLGELIPVLCSEISNVAETLTDQEVDRAKAQMRASLLIGLESMMTRADKQAKHMLFRDKPLDITALIKELDEIDTAQIKRTAQKIFKSPITLAALGPLKSLEGFDGINKRLAA